MCRISDKSSVLSSVCSVYSIAITFEKGEFSVAYKPKTTFQIHNLGNLQHSLFSSVREFFCFNQPVDIYRIKLFTFPSYLIRRNEVPLKQILPESQYSVEVTS